MPCTVGRVDDHQQFAHALAEQAWAQGVHWSAWAGCNVPTKAVLARALEAELSERKICTTGS